MEVFSRDEAEHILESSLKIAMSMRIADLRYFMLNTYESLKENCFFQCQEALMGKSLCDISLNDNQAIENALMNRQSDKYEYFGSIIYALTSQDRARMETFKQQDFFPKTLIITQDFNFVGTVERAVKYNAYKPLKLLLDHIFHVVNTSDYNDLIMKDLPIIINSNQVNANEFFRMGPAQAIENERQAQCNIELQFRNAEMPLFSDVEYKYITCDSLPTTHNDEIQLAQMIIHREAAVSRAVCKGYVVEHSYMDFSKLIIGDKIRAIAEGCSHNEVKFDDIYLSQILSKSGENNKSLYQCDSIQKIVDYQWVQARKMMKLFFFVYFIFYCLPISITLFTQSEPVHRFMLYVAMVPAIMIFVIEIIQMRQSGLGYLRRENMADIVQFIVFMTILILNHIRYDHEAMYIPQLKGILVILSTIKFLFFMRVFEAYGILIQIIGECVVELIPFFTFYIVFLIMFALSFTVLRMEVDSDNEQVEGLTYFGKVVLETFRTAIGEVGTPGYSGILAEKQSWWQDTNILLIWILWFAQAFSMLVIMLNFLIAVLQQTYNRIQTYQKIILYKQRAELNEECFTLTNIFYSLPRYKYIVFSFCSKAQQDDNYFLNEIRNRMKSMAQNQGKKVLKCQQELAKKLQLAQEGQQFLRNAINRAFDRISHTYEDVQRELISDIRYKKNQ